MKTKTDRNGVTTSYTYDIHGRLLSQSAAEETITNTYDGNGNQLLITDATVTKARTYDELNRVVPKAFPTSEQRYLAMTYSTTAFGILKQTLRVVRIKDYATRQGEV